MKIINDKDYTMSHKDYKIISWETGYKFQKEIQGCATFQYKGYTVSFSTSGILKQEVGLFLEGEEDEFLRCTVEEAIEYINKKTKE